MPVSQLIDEEMQVILRKAVMKLVLVVGGVKYPVVDAKAVEVPKVIEGVLGLVAGVHAAVFVGARVLALAMRLGEF